MDIRMTPYLVTLRSPSNHPERGKISALVEIERACDDVDAAIQAKDLAVAMYYGEREWYVIEVEEKP